jgi:hypothetical protein
MLVGSHIDAPPTKSYSLRLQAQPLLDRIVPTQLNFAARAHNPMPGHIKRAA